MQSKKRENGLQFEYIGFNARFFFLMNRHETLKRGKTRREGREGGNYEKGGEGWKGGGNIERVGRKS